MISSIMGNAVAEKSQLMQALAENVACIIKGKPDFIRQFLVAYFTRGHVLIEDKPGLGKTTIVKTLSKLIGGVESGRIQCTPDLLPYDITGVDVYEGTSGRFHFEKGPVFTDIFLADEINRATPKTQSAMLEAMAENQVTVGGNKYPLSEIFFVAATQNPVESEGAYPLPAAELDRFLIKISPGYPAFDDECQIVKDNPAVKILPLLTPIMSRDDVISIMEMVDTIYCDDKLIALAVRLAQATRTHPSVAIGVSPRGSLGLIRMAKSHALFMGRDYVTDEDILDLVPLVFAHRMMLADRRQSTYQILDDIVQKEIKNLL